MSSSFNREQPQQNKKPRINFYDEQEQQNKKPRTDLGLFTEQLNEERPSENIPAHNDARRNIRPRDEEEVNVSKYMRTDPQQLNEERPRENIPVNHAEQRNTRQRVEDEYEEGPERRHVRTDHLPFTQQDEDEDDEEEYSREKRRKVDMNIEQVTRYSNSPSFRKVRDNVVVVTNNTRPRDRPGEEERSWKKARLETDELQDNINQLNLNNMDMSPPRPGDDDRGVDEMDIDMPPFVRSMKNFNMNTSNKKGGKRSRRKQRTKRTQRKQRTTRLRRTKRTGRF